MPSARGQDISSSTTLSFTSQLSSLINTASNTSSKTRLAASSRQKGRKDDIFSKHNRNTAKRAKRDEEDSPAFEQKHTSNGEALDSAIWARSQRKMEEKARLYAAMKRGDVEDTDEKYAVDFDRKWTENGGQDQDLSDEQENDEGDSGSEEMVEYVDEFGRTRTGTASEAAKAARAVERTERARGDAESDRFTARPSAPSNVIYGDTIQYQAFNPDEPLAAHMAHLAAKRDGSLTPPPEEHFDSNKEVRTKGTAFFHFSGDAEERQRQMAGLEAERAETERRRSEREAEVAERRKEINGMGAKRKADDILDQLGQGLSQPNVDPMMKRLKDAVLREHEQ